MLFRSHASSYCGWAPLPPAAHFVSGVGFYHRGISVGVGFDFGLSARLYTFVPLAHFSDRAFQQHRVPESRAAVIYRDSTVVNNYVVHNTTVINNGVGVEAVSRASGHTIPTVTVRTGDRAAGDKPVRHEQLQNNGSSLAVVRPPLTAPPARTQLSSGNHAGFGAERSPGNNLPPSVRPASPNPALAARAAQTGKPAGSWPPLTQPRVGSTAARAETPATGVNLNPSVSQRPAAGQVSPANHVANSSPQFGSQSPWYRVYPTAPPAPSPASSHAESVAPQFSRSVPASPLQPRSQFAPGPGVMASPNHYSESARSPVMRAEPSRPAAPVAHPTASVPSAPHAAPARSSDSRSGSGRRD